MRAEQSPPSSQRRRIVVLDGFTLNPGDLDWAPLEELGDVAVYERSGDERIERARLADIVLTNKELIDAEFLNECRRLRYVGVLATGTNVVDLEAAREHHVVVTNVPGYSTESVAQHVFALLLELTNHVAAHANAVRAGRWKQCPDFSFTVAPISELADKALAIVGLGTIGRQVASIGHAFGMRILAADHGRSKPQLAFDVEWLPLNELFKQADVVTLHCPLTPETRHLVNRERLLTMKSSAVLINTGRGELVDEDALLEALLTRRIAAAALDVLSEEPPRRGNPLCDNPHCLVTPHLAWASREARQRLLNIAVRNIEAFLEGKPTNVVSTR